MVSNDESEQSLSFPEKKMKIDVSNSGKEDYLCNSGCKVESMRSATGTEFWSKVLK